MGLGRNRASERDGERQRDARGVKDTPPRRRRSRITADARRAVYVGVGDLEAGSGGEGKGLKSTV